MLNQSIKRLKSVIIVIINKKSDLASDLLTTDKQKTLNHVRNFLQNFYNAIKATKDYKVTLKDILLTIDFLANIFKDTIIEFAGYVFILKSL